MTNKEFDIIFTQKLQSYTASVPADLWNKISTNDLSGPKDGFDEYIKDKLYHHEAAIPANFWERVKPQEEEDKRRVVFWLPKKYMAAAAVLLLVLAGSVAAYLYTNSPQLPHPTNKESALPVATNDSIQDKNEPIIVEKTIIETTNRKGTSLAKKNSTEENKTAWKLNRKNITQSFKQKSSVFPFDQMIMNNHQEIVSDNLLQKESIELNNPSEIPDYEIAEKAGNAYIKQRRNLTALYNKELSKFNHASSFRNVVICPTDRKMRNPDWDLEVYVSPDMPFKSITNNSASPQLLSRKDSSESLRPGFSAGIRIVKPLTDNFAIKTGLQYSQINERFTYRTENETRTTTVVTVRSIIRAPGDTLIVRDTSSLTQIGYKTNTVKNRFKSLDIPILASYQIGNDDLRFGITAGVIVNLSSWYQGVILDSSLSAVPLSKETNMVYKNNIGLGLYAGFTVTKRINYATQLFFEPYLRYNLSNMTNPEATFNQRFSIGGLAMGLRFNLNKR